MTACRALIAAEGTLTELDRITGDGDLGISMARAAKAVLGSLGLLSPRRRPTYSQSAWAYPAARVRRVLRASLWSSFPARQQRPRPSHGYSHGNWTRTMGDSTRGGLRSDQPVGRRAIRRPGHAGCDRSVRERIEEGSSGISRGSAGSGRSRRTGCRSNLTDETAHGPVELSWRPRARLSRSRVRKLSQSGSEPAANHCSHANPSIPLLTREKSTTARSFVRSAKAGRQSSRSAESPSYSA